MIFRRLCSCWKQINRNIQNDKQNKSSQYIKHGMLFDEERRQYNSSRKHYGAISDRSDGSDFFVVTDRCIACHGIEAVNAWKYIGWRIRCVHCFNQRYTEIIMCKGGWTKLKTIWIDIGYDQKQSHADAECQAQLIIILPLQKNEGNDRSCHIKKPEIIWDHKIFAERDLVVNAHFDDMDLRDRSFFQIEKDKQIDRCI